jgi:Ni/Fe-hydrogenase subunit HybB-like protein
VNFLDVIFWLLILAIITVLVRPHSQAGTAVIAMADALAAVIATATGAAAVNAQSTGGDQSGG